MDDREMYKLLRNVPFLGDTHIEITCEIVKGTILTRLACA